MKKKNCNRTKKQDQNKFNRIKTSLAIKMIITIKNAIESTTMFPNLCQNLFLIPTRRFNATKIIQNKNIFYYFSAKKRSIWNSKLTCANDCEI
jgi:hypothetical protein